LAAKKEKYVMSAVSLVEGMLQLYINGSDHPGSVFAWAGFFFLPQCPMQLWAHPASCSVGTGFPVVSGWGMKLTTHVHVVPRINNV
jgi:hypothetical protein